MKKYYKIATLTGLLIIVPVVASVSVLLAILSTLAVIIFASWYWGLKTLNKYLKIALPLLILGLLGLIFILCGCVPANNYHRDQGMTALQTWMRSQKKGDINKL